MALQKDIYIPEKDYTVSYWRIVSQSIDHVQQLGQVRLAGYKNQQLRDQHPVDGAMALRTFNFTPNGAKEQEDVIRSFPFSEPGCPRQQAYEAIKQLPAWADAVDVLES